MSEQRHLFFFFLLLISSLSLCTLSPFADASMQRSARGEREDKEAPSSSTWLRRMRIRDATAAPQILRRGKPWILWHSFLKSFHLWLILRIPLRPHANRKGKKKKRRIWLSLQGSKAAKGKREEKKEMLHPIKKKERRKKLFPFLPWLSARGKRGGNFFFGPLAPPPFSPFFLIPTNRFIKQFCKKINPTIFHLFANSFEATLNMGLGCCSVRCFLPCSC